MYVSKSVEFSIRARGSVHENFTRKHEITLSSANSRQVNETVIIRSIKCVQRSLIFEANVVSKIVRMKSVSRPKNITIPTFVSV